jgi:hypothetical protein
MAEPCLKSEGVMRLGPIGAKITHVIPATAGIHLQARRTTPKKSWMAAPPARRRARGVTLPKLIMR